MDRRKATKTEIDLALNKLKNALPKAKGMNPDKLFEIYEEALDGVSALALVTATLNLIRTADYFPSTSEFYQAIQAVEHGWDKPQEREKRQHDPDADVLTPGQKLGYPLLRDDPAARARCAALWARVRPTLGTAKGFDRAAEDMAELRREHGLPPKPGDKPEPEPVQLSDEERMQRLKDQASDMPPVTDALLRSLKNPMNPPKREG